jgi:carbon-monoxide dehydrogenase large subunit
VLALGAWTPREGFARSAGGDALWTLKLPAEAGAGGDYSTFDVCEAGKVLGTVRWGLLGAHNAENALAAIGAARSAGVSVERATRALGSQLREIAADALETSAGDLEISEGRVRIAGTDRSVSFADLAKRSGVDAAKLDASATFASADGTYPNGTHLAEVEIDPATGIVKIVNYVIVDDFGVTLNPLLLAGQVHGGAMQGIGQALMEQVVYSPGDAQLVTATFMDYALPRAADGPSFVFETHNVPCKTNPMGVKGAGEAGAIGSCPAVVNAIVDALWREYKIDHIDMPATPERVWIAVNEHHRRHSL